MPSSIVVFDLDDTLFLERTYVWSGFEAVGAAVAARLGIDRFANVAWRIFESGVRGTVFDRALDECHIKRTVGLVDELVTVYRSHRPEIDLLPDAALCIDTFRAAATALGVISDGPIESQRAKAEALEARRWAQHVVLTAELPEGHQKPSAEPFRLLEQLSGSAGPGCVYVGDNPVKDFAAPRVLGWRTVRVRRPGSLHAEVPSGADVDLEVDDLVTLPAWVEGD